jgi:DNA-directed RNA polymerase specialized sigma24 family protein
MAARKSKPVPAPRSLAAGALSERQQFDLSQALQALSSPLTRHFVELLAIEPRSSADLARHFDLTSKEATTAAHLLIEAGLARLSSDEQCYQLDHRALELIRSWLNRIAPLPKASWRTTGHSRR